MVEDETMRTFNAWMRVMGERADRAMLAGRLEMWRQIRNDQGSREAFERDLQEWMAAWRAEMYRRVDAQLIADHGPRAVEALRRLDESANARKDQHTPPPPISPNTPGET